MKNDERWVLYLCVKLFRYISREAVFIKQYWVPNSLIIKVWHLIFLLPSIWHICRDAELIIAMRACRRKHTYGRSKRFKGKLSLNTDSPTIQSEKNEAMILLVKVFLFLCVCVCVFYLSASRLISFSTCRCTFKYVSQCTSCLWFSFSCGMSLSSTSSFLTLLGATCSNWI